MSLKYLFSCVIMMLFAAVLVLSAMGMTAIAVGGKLKKQR